MPAVQVVEEPAGLDAAAWVAAVAASAEEGVLVQVDLELVEPFAAAAVALRPEVGTDSEAAVDRDAFAASFAVLVEPVASFWSSFQY